MSETEKAWELYTNGLGFVAIKRDGFMLGWQAATERAAEIADKRCDEGFPWDIGDLIRQQD